MAAFQRELIYVGCGEGVRVGTNLWDAECDAGLCAFQKEQGLTVDGQLGPETAALLFQQRIVNIERRMALPAGLLGRLKTHLSQNDPVAEAVHDLDCEGLAQINMRYNPMISLTEAWDPRFALEHIAQFLQSANQYVGDWEGAVAAYLIGRGPAADWVSCGKPDSGGVTLGDRDAFTRATEYVAAVQEAAC